LPNFELFKWNQISFYFVFTVLGIELMVSHWLVWCSTTWATLPALVCLGLQSSVTAFWVAGITGVLSPWRALSILFLFV
jgi:hypothetical protein